MSKRKRASLGKTSTGGEQPAGEPGTTPAADDAVVKDDMVHVTPDLLAGSPDIFAPKWSSDEPAKDVVTEPVVEAPSEPVETAEAPAPATAESDPIIAPPIAVRAAPPPPPRGPPARPKNPAPLFAPRSAGGAAPPPPPRGQPARPRSTGSSAALGVVLVVVG